MDQSRQPVGEMQLDRPRFGVPHVSIDQILGGVMNRTTTIRGVARRVRAGVVLLAAALMMPGAVVVAAEVAPTGRVVETATHKFEEVAPGVWFAMGTGSIFVMSNSLVVVNEDGVVIVDSHITPAAARALQEALKAITDKPVKTLINSHHHYDHAHGNQAFGTDIEIIGHEFTRERLAATPLQEPTFLRDKEGMPKRLVDLKQRLEAATDPEERKKLASQVDVITAHIEATKEIAPLAPNISFNDRLTLHRGGREIQLLFLGRAHTAGDVAIYLPKEKLVFTGDMMLGGVSWLGDGYVDEWPATLERLKSLDFEMILPGHGGVIRDRQRIDYVQAYYRDLWAGVVALRDAGVSAEDAAKQIDLTRHKVTLNIKDVGADPLAVARIYALLDERAAKP